MRPRIMTKPRLRRRLYMAGRIAPKSRPCRFGHVGPWVADAPYTEWVRGLMEQVGMGPLTATMGQCQACLSHTAMPEAN